MKWREYFWPNLMSINIFWTSNYGRKILVQEPGWPKILDQHSAGRASTT
ncbi:MAG TPA: hypothetical protein VGO91_10685 [Pyrinomonadaceae bacterium]|nr:hypothetical protein [Pyrinomonadaceae bacterium]